MNLVLTVIKEHEPKLTVINKYYKYICNISIDMHMTFIPPLKAIASLFFAFGDVRKNVFFLV